MINVLKSQGKIRSGWLIKNQPRAVIRRAMPAVLVRIATPTRLSPQGRTNAERDTGGGVGAQVSLPLCVTPFHLFRPTGGRV
jgi:hypothetical protein